MPITQTQIEAADRDQRDRAQETLDARMEMFNAGRVSYGAAVAGGDEYTLELRESAVVAELVVEPVAIAVNGWLNAQRAAVAPRYAAIGNGIFVRVGTGKKRRAA
jgi:hypothetical protein